MSYFVTGATGGKLRGLRRLPRVAPITISSLHPLHVTHQGVLHRRTTELIHDDVEVRPDGIRIASPHRLAFDLAADKQVCALTVHDSRVLARRTVKAKAWQLAQAVSWRLA